LGRTLAKYRRPLPPADQIESAVGKGLSLPETIALLDPSLRSQSSAITEMVGAYRSLYQSEGDPLVKAFPGAAIALQNVRAGGAKCVVVSNKGTDAIRRSLDRYRLAPFIDLVLGDEPQAAIKPDPVLLTARIAPKFPQITKHRMLMVGDTEVDIKFAQAAKIACCWAAYGFGNRQRCAALSPEYVIDAIEELPRIVSGSEA
jgi:phosphoglycolate phosphatase